MDFGDSSVKSELLNDLSDLELFGAVEKLVEDFDHLFFLGVVHSFSDLFDVIDFSPSLECVAHVAG